MIEQNEQITALKNEINKFARGNTSLNSLLKWLKAALRLGKQVIGYCTHPIKAYRLSRDIRTIKNSSLFDVAYYLSNYRDIRISTCSPLYHYCETGWKEGRNPSSLFNTNDYLMNNPDVAALGTNPFVHYIKFGQFEARDPLSVDNINASPDLCRRAELMLHASDGIRRILVIDYAVPTPDRDSGSVRMFGILRIMRNLGFSVTFAADKLENELQYISALNDLEVNVLQGYTEIRSHLQKYGNGYFAVIVSRPEMGERYLSVVRAYAAHAQLDYDTVDLYYLRFKRGAELTGNPDLVKKAQEYYQLEMLCCATADRVFAITDTEKKIIQQNWPNSQVEVIPNIHSVNVSLSPWSAREGLVFIGGYDHQPNVDAVVWFVQEILPIIAKSIPGIKFTILGSNPPDAVCSLASSNVIVEGWVPDPEPYFCATRVFVAPLRYGAGMKGKVGQAMSLGLPVVTTQIGAEGMQLKDNVHALIADTPEAFAAAVVRLYNDEALWKRIQQGSAAHIDKNFSESAVESILLKIWAESGHKQKSIPPLDISEAFSYKDYNIYIDTHRDTNLAIQSSENSLLPSTPTEFTVNGYCYICKTNVDFLVDFKYSYEVDGVVTPNWRERLVCPSCLLNNRMRAIAHVFEDTLHPKRNAKIFITEQTTSLYKLIRQSFPKTIGSEYLGDVVDSGKCDDNGIRNEDLTHLSFDNDAFDYIMSFDVFEHIPDYKRALAECYRCLKPGGILYFTVPFVKTSEKNIVRARLSGTGEVIHLLDPEYHGDPLSSNGCLCFYHFGWEILDDLRELGFEDAKALIFWSLQLGYLGGHQIILLASKSPRPTTLL